MKFVYAILSSAVFAMAGPPCSAGPAGADSVMRLNEGRKLAAEARWGDVLQAASTELATSPNNPEWLLLEARAYRMLGDSSNALAACNRAVAAAGPGSAADGLTERAWAHAMLQSWTNALADARAASKAKPESGAARFLEGIALRELRDWSGASRSFAQAIRLEPTNTAAILNHGRACMELGDLTNAVSDFTQVINMAPTIAQAFSLRGRVRIMLQDRNGAVRDQTRAIELDPQSASAFFYRALIYEESGAYGEAVRDAGRAAGAATNDVRPCLLIARVAERTGDWKMLEDFARKAVRLQSASPAAYRLLGHAQWEQGRPDDAIASYRRAAECDPVNRKAYEEILAGLLETQIKKPETEP